MSLDFIITGMVRSGTTLTAKTADAQAGTFCPADPIFPFFRAFRNDLYAAAGIPVVGRTAPLTDFFFAPSRELEVCAAASLDLPVVSDRDVLLAELQQYLRSALPECDGAFDAITAVTYRDLLIELLEKLRRHCARDGVRALGLKQTWVEAFMPAVMNAFPNARVLHIVRDPRALIASWKKSNDLGHDYPFLMMIRHWRKSVALGRMHARKFPRCHVVRYEDFVADAHASLRRILPELRREDFVASSSWKGNSSYQKETDRISGVFVERWTERLSIAELGLIEGICEPEMSAMGYARRTPEAARPDFPLIEKMLRGVEADQSWVAGFGGKYAANDSGILKEILRRGLLRISPERADAELTRLAFIDPQLAAERPSSAPA